MSKSLAEMSAIAQKNAPIITNRSEMISILAMLSDAEIDILLDNQNKSRIAEAIAAYQQSHSQTWYDCGCDCRLDYNMQNLSQHSRAFIKVEDGCTNHDAMLYRVGHINQVVR